MVLDCDRRTRFATDWERALFEKKNDGRERHEVSCLPSHELHLSKSLPTGNAEEREFGFYQRGVRQSRRSGKRVRLRVLDGLGRSFILL